MSNFKYDDLTGTINKWTVVERCGDGRWLCICECGRESKVPSGQLVNGISKGCKPCALELSSGEASFNEVYATYRRNALKANREFLITKEQARELFKRGCAYCGCEPSSYKKPKNRIKTGFCYNGIDRLDNNIGYVLGNCVTCCYVCNHMKHVLSEDRFLEHISKIYKKRIENV